jgi:hypothetical protein
MRISTPVAAAVLALAAGQARGETVDVTSTTMLQLGQQTRGRNDPFNPELVTVAPVFEILSISARDVQNPVLPDLSLFVSTWGSYDIQELRWDAGTTSKWNGDFQTLYAQTRLLDRRLTIRAGRELVSTGVGRMMQLDGGEAIALLPAGFRLQGYVGSPVTQRFQSRDVIRSWNPVGGDLAYGGRLAWAYGAPGYPGRGIEIGASANYVMDGGSPVRQEIGGDLRLQPLRDLTFTGLASYSVYDERASELLARATYSVTRKLRVEADAHYIAPDLFLARNSILSVFATNSRQDYGAAFTYELGHGLGVGAGYHLIVEPGEHENSGDYYGSEAHGSVEWHRGATLAGFEVEFLDALENGYTQFRVFGRQDYKRFFATADVMADIFRKSINGEDFAVTGTLSGGVELAKGFSAVIAGQAGVTPFLEQTYSLMAKLVYNASYRSREVR